MRYAGKLFHLGIGRAYASKSVLLVITDNHITTSLQETGAIITEHYIDTARDYQKPYWKHGDPHQPQNEQNRPPEHKTLGNRFVHHVATHLSNMSRLRTFCGA